jgi:hypothetical protein
MSELILLFFIRKGSLIAEFTVLFSYIDSFQLVYLMDSLEVGQAFQIFDGKIAISLQTTSNFSALTGNIIINFDRYKIAEKLLFF